MTPDRRLCGIVMLSLASVTAVYPSIQLAYAEEVSIPEVAMPLMAAAPAIDGRIDEAEWRHAVRQVGLASHGTRALTTRESIVWFAFKSG